MKSTKPATTERLTAEERREAIITEAISEFAQFGLHGASVEAIATRLGISQPYVYRLFQTKKELFMAAVQRVYENIQILFQRAVEADPTHPFPAMGCAYEDLLKRRNELLLILQSFSSSADSEVQQAVRQHNAKLYARIQALSHGSDEEVRDFFKVGIFLTFAAALDLQSLAKKEAWAHDLMEQFS